jgi:hypothetical protein
MEITSERNGVQGCTTAHSKANVTLMFGKIKALGSKVRKLRNYAILCNNLFCCVA